MCKGIKLCYNVFKLDSTEWMCACIGGTVVIWCIFNLKKKFCTPFTLKSLLGLVILFVFCIFQKSEMNQLI